MGQASDAQTDLLDEGILFVWDLVAEADLQRLGRLLLEAGQDLGISSFRLSQEVLKVMPLLRHAMQNQGLPFPVVLRLVGGRLSLSYGEGKQSAQELAVLDAMPDAALLRPLASKLRNATENADPQRLRQRNREIERYLEAAQLRAETELAQMEALLESRQQALRESIHRAEHDALTGLFNRGTFDQHLEQAVCRAQRQQEPLCLLLLDLDKFKEINDTHGHQYGDQWLQRMAKAMSGAVRSGVDEVFRFGGDEFAMLIYAAPEIAQRAAERVLAAMDNAVSIGIACLRADDVDVKAFTARADAALYEVKRNGRGHYYFSR